MFTSYIFKSLEEFKLQFTYKDLVDLYFFKKDKIQIIIFLY